MVILWLLVKKLLNNDGSIKSGTASQLATEIINEAANENTTN